MNTVPCTVPNACALKYELEYLIAFNLEMHQVQVAWKNRNLEKHIQKYDILYTESKLCNKPTDASVIQQALICKCKTQATRDSG